MSAKNRLKRLEGKHCPAKEPILRIVCFGDEPGMAMVIGKGGGTVRRADGECEADFLERARALLHKAERTDGKA